MSLGKKEFEIMRADNLKTQQWKNGQAEVEAMQASPEIKAELARNEQVRQIFINEAQKQARELLNNYASILPLDTRRGVLLCSRIKELVTELSRIVNNAEHGNFGETVRRVESVSPERIWNRTIRPFAEEIRESVDSNARLIGRVQELTRDLHFNLEKYYERRPKDVPPGMYAEEGVRPPASEPVTVVQTKRPADKSVGAFGVA